MADRDFHCASLECEVYPIIADPLLAEICSKPQWNFLIDVLFNPVYGTVQNTPLFFLYNNINLQ